MRKRLRIKIYGNVQGVGFRFSASRKARALGLRGFVRNCDDGCVEIEAEGEEAAVDKYRQWCRKGPMFARVDKVEEEWGGATGAHEEFAISY